MSAAPSNPPSSELWRTLASYLPRYQAHRLIQGVRRGHEPFVENRFGSILLIDVSGFTSLTERFAAQGANGSERLSGILKQYFAEIVTVVTDCGGDILIFAGDSALAMWASEQSDCAAQVILATQAGLTIQSRLDSFQPAPGIMLRQRAGVGCGELQLAELGGVSGCWQSVVTGKAILQSCRANQIAQPGEVLLAPEAWHLAHKVVRGTQLPSGFAKALEIGTPEIAAPRAELTPSIPVSELVAALSLQVPMVVSDRLAAGQDRWIAEFRTVSMLFVGLGEPRLGGRGSVLSLHRHVRSIQETMARFEGTLYQFLMDDKGLTAVCAFGLPPLAHENDPRRAVEAAISIHEQLSRVGTATSVGISTGSVFCGVYGNEFRQQYTTLGRTINLSARLMQATEGSILCDESTFLAARTPPNLRFESKGEIGVKGRSDLIRIFEPRLNPDGMSTTRPAIAVHEKARLIVGRVAERAALAEALASLVERRESRCIVVESEAGVGKSCLLDDFSEQIARARQNGRAIHCWRSAADSIQQATPYHVWRAVLFQALSLADLPLGGHRDHLLLQISRHPELESFAPLLNAILPLSIPESDATAALQSQPRAEALQHLLIQLLQVVAQQSPTVIILEDAHWFDSPSLRLALLAAQQITPLLLVISTRPVTGPPLAEFDALIALSSTARFHLDVLSEDESLVMICQDLGVSRLPPEVAHFIQERAGGHPLFGQQLSFALRDAGVIRIVDGRCLIAEAATGEAFGAALSATSFPSTVEGVITSRLDRMLPDQQLTLKVASILGQTFRSETLCEIYPAAAERSKISAHLRQIENLDLIHRLNDYDDKYTFQNAVAHDVAYNSVPFALRRELHRCAAEAYEREFHHELPSHSALLAHHWSRAEVVPKAVQYCSEAGAQALRNHANREAVRFFSEALRFDENNKAVSKSDAAASSARRSEWELQLGRAYVNWSKYVEGRTHLERGLALQQQRVPSSAGAAAGLLIVEVLRQGMHRLSPSRYRRNRQRDRAELLSLARNFEALTEIYFLQDKSLHCLLAVFRSLNQAELAGASPELARGYSSAGSLLGFMTLHRAANSYFNLAQKVCAEINDRASSAWVSLARAVYLIGLGHWEKASGLLRDAMSITDAIGDSRRGDDARIMLTLVELFRGRFSESLAIADALYKSAKARLDVRIQSEALYGRAWNLLLLNRLNELPACIDELDLLRSAQVKIGGSHRKQDVHSLRASLHFESKNFAAAKECADLVMQARSGSYLCNDILVSSAISEVYLGLWQNSCPSNPSQASAVSAENHCYEQSFNQSLRKLRAYSRIFPIGKPLLLLRQGQYQWIRGNRAKAISLWEDSLQAATTLRADYYQGLTHLELGIRMGRSSAAGEKHLHAAQEILARLGAGRDLARLARSSSADEAEKP